MEPEALSIAERFYSKEELKDLQALCYCKTGGNHEWKFLRQRTEPITREYRHGFLCPERTIDIFYCQKCLAKHEVPA